MYLLCLISRFWINFINRFCKLVLKNNALLLLPFQIKLLNLSFELLTNMS